MGEITKEWKPEELMDFDLDTVYDLGLRLPTITTFVADERPTLEENEALRLENLATGYSRKKRVCEHLNLSIKEKEIVAMVGNNGIGKSTFAKTLCGLLKEQEGSIYIAGEKLEKKKKIV